MPAEAALRHLMTLNHRSTDRPIDRSRNPAKLTSCTVGTLRGPRSITVVRVGWGQGPQGHSGLIGCRGRPPRRRDREKHPGRLSSLSEAEITRDPDVL